MSIKRHSRGTQEAIMRQSRGRPCRSQTCARVPGMQSVCNQYAIIEQSACHQRTISVREVGEEPFGREEELGGGCRRVVWHAECRLRNGDSDQQVHSACTRHAISVQSECPQQMHSACTRHAISEPARRRPRAPACIGAREARTADQGAAASSCAWRGGRRR